MTAGAEAIVALEPDLVLLMHAPTTEPLTGELEALDVRVERLEARRLTDVPRIARRLGEWLDATQAADSLARAFSARIAEVRDRARRPDRPSVFYLLWHDPPWTAGTGTFIGDLIEVAGGRHAFPDADGAWPRNGVEAVVERDPDVLVVPTGTLPDEPLCWLRDAPGWSDLTAVREGRVVVVPRDLFNRPSPRLAQAAEPLARALHRPAAEAKERRDGRAAAVRPGEPGGRRAWGARSASAGSACSP